MRWWARLTTRPGLRPSNLYLQEGVGQGEQILPEGFAAFVRTPAPAWEAGGRPIHGGFFWINSTGGFPIPNDAYFLASDRNRE